uniref:interstitial collagenase n=1 Tax=Paramormyrops kingsleyae TaxID=1676925 RepID=A0A3B3RV76_9TELE
MCRKSQCVRKVLTGYVLNGLNLRRPQLTLPTNVTIIPISSYYLLSPRMLTTVRLNLAWSHYPAFANALLQTYLKMFYELKDNPDDRIWRFNPFTLKLKEMQQFFRLKVTGVLDDKTLEVMKKPRCGVPDMAEYSTFPGNPKWPNNNVTYRIKNYTPDLSVLLRFTLRQRAFVPLDHGDPYPFDGPDGTLAHAFSPSSGFGGDTHFDEDETFTSHTTAGYNLFIVAAHEFGHALGLSHSTDPGALMYPMYSYRDPSTFTLPYDDVKGIQFIYGSNPNVNQGVTDVPPPQTPDPCDPKLVLDAVASLRGEVMFFKDKFFWRSVPQSNQQELHLIASFWPEVPNNIDAAYENPSLDRVFLFKGNQVWALSGYDIVPGYPKNLTSMGLPARLQKITAAVYDKASRKTLFFVNKHYFSYDESKGKMDKGYPKLVKNTFPGMTERVTAAFQLHGFTYLSSGRRLYEYSYQSQRLHRQLPGTHFLNC